MLISATVATDRERNRVRVDVSRSDDGTVMSMYLDCAQAWWMAQQLIRHAGDLDPEQNRQQ